MKVFLIIFAIFIIPILLWGIVNLYQAATEPQPEFDSLIGPSF